MVKIDERDWKILNFLRGGREARWSELLDSGMMAKSTLSKHLRGLRENKLIRKKFSETANCVVYVMTAKGKRTWADFIGAGMSNIEDFM